MGHFIAYLAANQALGIVAYAAGLMLVWLARFRRLVVRYERLGDIDLAWLDLGCALICFKALRASTP